MGDVIGSSRGATGQSDADGFVEWVRPHWEAMATLARRLVGTSDADDVLQEALLSAWRKWDSYDAGRGSPRVWLLAITADQARKAWRRPSNVTLLDSARAPHGGGPRDLDVERVVHQLPARVRTAVALHYFLDLPVAEVARVMKCSEGTVKTMLFRARARLRTLLGDDYR